MQTAEAIEIARDALIWLAGRPDDLERFLELGGARRGEVLERCDEPEFLGFVLDFLLESEDAVLAFAAAADLPPGAPKLAREALPGGELPEWT
jgi:Protein of unknown function (DUF3572)